MKAVRYMIFKSKIGRRLMLLLLSFALGASAIVFSLSYDQLQHIFKISVSSQKKLSSTTETEAGTALFDQTETVILSFMDVLTDYFEMTFDRVEAQMDTLSYVLRELYKSGDFVSHLPVNAFPAGEAENDVAMGRTAITAGVPQTLALLQERNRISALDPVAQSMYYRDRLISNILIGTESGLFYRYSAYSNYQQGYDPRVRPWYTSAMANPGEVVWSSAYTDIYDRHIVTCSMSYTDGNGNIAGVIGIDVLIDSLVENLLDGEDMEYSHLLLLDGNFQLLAATDKATEYLDLPVKDHVIEFTPNEQGILCNYTEMSSQYAARIETTGWYYCLVIPYETIITPVYAIVEDLDKLSDRSIEEMTELRNASKKRYNTFMIIAGVIMLFITWWVAEKARRPLEKLTQVVRKMGGGDLGVQVEVTGDDEIAELGRAFNHMSTDLREHVKHERDAAKETERTRTELNVAHKIQTGMLPCTFPAFPDDDRFDIYAAMRTAREVGGDFYDYFKLDDDHLVIAIADVSGKGIPAALFMVVTRTLIRDYLLTGYSVSEALNAVNNRLCESNSQDMFVTVWLGVVDLRTGSVQCANAGHEYPILRNGPEGICEVFKDPHSLVLGGMPGMKYKEYTLQMNPGECILVFTDGITEAQDPEQKLFGIERTLEAVNTDPGADPKTMVETVFDAADTFAGTAEQFDDMTILCWKRLK